MPLNFIPIAVKTTAHITIIGGSPEGIKKAKRLARLTDQVTFISPEIPEALRSLPFHFIERTFEAGDLKDTKILYVCTADQKENHRIKQIAENRGILTSVCDDPDYCDFVSPAVFLKDNLTISVGSDARDVRRSIRIRNRIRQLIEQGILDIT